MQMQHKRLASAQVARSRPMMAVYVHKHKGARSSIAGGVVMNAAAVASAPVELQSSTGVHLFCLQILTILRTISSRSSVSFINPTLHTLQPTLLEGLAQCTLCMFVFKLHSL